MRTSLMIAGLILVFSAFMITGAEGITVKITNNLGGGKKMALHCRSKDDDLGQWEISNGDEFHWSFHLGFFGKTLFSCQIWQGDVQGFVFDANVVDRDYYHRSCYPDERILWRPSDEGMYSSIPCRNTWDIYIPWHKSN